MAGNQGFPHFNGPNGHQIPTAPPGPGGRFVPISMQQQPAPPRAGFPVDLAGGPSVEISDVSRDLLTLDDMKEELADYAIFRFEKMNGQSKYDDEGRLQLPTWDRAIRTRVPGMPPGEIARQIRHLNQHSATLADKLKSLNPVLQRQIDRAQEHLTLHNLDPTNYHWILTQLDHQLREINLYVVTGGDRSPTRRHHGSTRRRSRSRKRGNKKRAYERISLTAYFKRVPRPSIDIPTLYQAKKRATLPQHHIMTQPNPGLDIRTSPPGHGPLGGGPALGLNGGRSAGNPSPIARHSNGLEPGGGHVAARNATADGRGEGKGVVRIDNDFGSDLDYSDSSLSDRSFDTQMTPNTSQSSGSLSGRKNRDLGHSKDWVPTRNTSGRRGEDGHSKGPPKRNVNGERHRTLQNAPRIPHVAAPGPAPLYPATPGVGMNRIRDDAYFRGIRDGGGDARIAQQRGIHEVQRSRSRPRVIREEGSPHAHRRRYIADGESRGFRHGRDFGDEVARFSRLSLDDEDDYEAAMRGPDGGRRREVEYFLQHGSIMGEDPFDRDMPPYERNRGRRYREPYITEGSDSGFSPPRRSEMLFRH
ncbi:hypothetical protein AAE478_002811 [Parahypoxylon ruwenzoriense]